MAETRVRNSSWDKKKEKMCATRRDMDLKNGRGIGVRPPAAACDDDGKRPW